MFVQRKIGSPARDPIGTKKASCESYFSTFSGSFGPAAVLPRGEREGEREKAQAPFPLSYSRIKAFEECPHRFYLRYFEGLPEAQGKGRKHNGLILRALFNAYLGNRPTPLLPGDNLSRDIEQIDFGVQFLKSKEVVALDIPFALDRFSNPVPFDEPEVIFRGVAQAVYEDEQRAVLGPSSRSVDPSFVKQRPETRGERFEERESEDLRLEVRGERSEERRDFGYLTSNLIPHTSVPPNTSSWNMTLSEGGGQASESGPLVLCHFKAGFGDPDWERLMIYAWALSRHGYDIGRVEWVSLSAGSSASRQVCSEDLEEAGMNLFAWIRQIAGSAFIPEAGDHCSYCLYHSLCPLMDKLGEDLTITDNGSLKRTLQKSVAFQEGAKKMKKLADRYIDSEGIGKVALEGYEYASDEVSPRIVITDRLRAFEALAQLEEPLRYISFRNLEELVQYLPCDCYQVRERLKPDRRFKKAG